MVQMFENTPSLHHEADPLAAHTSASETHGGGGGAAGGSSPVGVAMGAALGAEDSLSSPGSDGADSSTAAPSGVVDAAGGISSSDELSDEAACVGGEHITLCEVMDQKT